MLESHPQSLCVDFQLEQSGGFKLHKDTLTSAYARLLPFGGTEAAPVAHVSGTLLLSHAYNSERMELFAHGVLWPTVAAIAEVIATQEKTWFVVRRLKKNENDATKSERSRSKLETGGAEAGGFKPEQP